MPKRASTSKQDERIAKVFEENPDFSLREGVERLRRPNINVSRGSAKKIAWKVVEVTLHHEKTAFDTKTH